MRDEQRFKDIEKCNEDYIKEESGYHIENYTELYKRGEYIKRADKGHNAFFGMAMRSLTQLNLTRHAHIGLMDKHALLKNELKESNEKLSIVVQCLETYGNETDIEDRGCLAIIALNKINKLENMNEHLVRIALRGVK